MKPTPLQQLTAFDLRMKRDDLCVCSKTRMIQHILDHARINGIKRVFSFGSIHSNHCRLLAQSDLDVKLVIIDEHAAEACFPGAELVIARPAEARDVIESEQAGRWFIPGGGASGLGVAAYISLGQELAQQFEQSSVPDIVAMPTGTATTLTGVAIGLAGSTCQIVGLSIARSADRCRQEVERLHREACEYLEADLPLADIRIVEDTVGEGYGILARGDEQIAQRLETEDGIRLDRIYNAKAFGGLVRLLQTKIAGRVVYLNTGGGSIA